MVIAEIETWEPMLLVAGSTRNQVYAAGVVIPRRLEPSSSSHFESSRNRRQESGRKCPSNVLVCSSRSLLCSIQAPPPPETGSELWITAVESQQVSKCIAFVSYSSAHYSLCSACDDAFTCWLVLLRNDSVPVNKYICSDKDK